jgi:hypothetical protein
MSEMPETIKSTFDDLKDEVAWLHTIWENHRQLFQTSEKRRKLLAEWAYAFFLIIHQVLIDNVLLLLSKLTDPAGEGKTQRLSSETLQKRVEKHGDHKLVSELKETLGKLKEKSHVIRTHRNKRLAHIDMEVKMKRAELDHVSVEMVEEMLALAGAYMNAVEGHYYQREVRYQFGIDSYSDADALVTKLRHGLRFEQLIKDEKIPSEDLFGGEWSGA